MTFEKNEDENRLWQRIMRDVTVYATGNHKKSSRTPKSKEQDRTTPTAAFTPPRPLDTYSYTTARHHAMPPMPKKWQRSIKNGTQLPDGRLDLHGLTTGAAHQRFLGFFRTQDIQGKRLLLVITGKGKAGEGRIRRELRFWLEDSAVFSRLAGVMAAPPNMGGEGATLLLLKRRR